MIQEFCSGIRLKAIFKAGLAWVFYHRNELNSLNSYPVSDGDTGTNICGTLQGAWSLLEKTKGKHAGTVAKAASLGALNVAAGCSGLILSNFFIGFSESVASKDVIYASDFAGAFLSGANLSKDRAFQPKDGTLVAFSLRCSETAVNQASDQKGLGSLIDDIYAEAKKSLPASAQPSDSNSSALLDAGVCGFAYFIEGIWRYSHGQALSAPAGGTDQDVVRSKSNPEFNDKYSVEFGISAEDATVESIREMLIEAGDNLMIASIDKIFKIHLYTLDPRRVFDKTSRLGKPVNIKVDDFSMKTQGIFSRGS